MRQSLKKFLFCFVSLLLVGTILSNTFILPKENTAKAVDMPYSIVTVKVNTPGVKFYSNKSTTSTVLCTAPQSVISYPMCLYRISSDNMWHEVQLGPNSGVGANGYAYVLKSQTSLVSYSVTNVWKTYSSVKTYNSPGSLAIELLSAGTYLYGYGSSSGCSRVYVHNNGIPYVGYCNNLSSCAYNTSVSIPGPVNYTLTPKSNILCCIRRYPYNDSDSIYAYLTSGSLSSSEQINITQNSTTKMWFKVSYNNDTGWIREGDVNLS